MVNYLPCCGCVGWWWLIPRTHRRLIVAAASAQFPLFFPRRYLLQFTDPVRCACIPTNLGCTCARCACQLRCTDLTVITCLRAYRQAHGDVLSTPYPIPLPPFGRSATQFVRCLLPGLQMGWNWCDAPYGALHFVVWTLNSVWLVHTQPGRW